MPLSSASASVHPELSLAELEQWLLDTEVSGKRRRLADCLVQSFAALLTVATKWYSNDAVAFSPALDVIRFPVAHLPQLAQALSDGVVDCFIIEAYPPQEWFDARPEARDLSPFEFALACTTGKIEVLNTSDFRFETVVMNDEDLETLRMGRIGDLETVGCDDMNWEMCCAAFRKLYSAIPSEKKARALAGTARIVFTATDSMQLSRTLPPVPRRLRPRVAHGSFVHFMLTSPFSTVTPVEWLAVQHMCSVLGIHRCAGQELTAGMTRSSVVHASSEPAGFKLCAASPETPAFRFRAAI